MKIVECAQGSYEWHMARLGIPTASGFARIVTPAGRPSAQADGYLHELVAERLLGHPLETEAIGWMDRGLVTEAEAVRYYEMQRECDTRKVGFVTTDHGLAGCSPDRLVVGERGSLEIKCPSAAVHVGYMLDVEPRKYWPQIQGALWVTGFDWLDFLSYCPELPPALTRYERDEMFIKVLAEAVGNFSNRLDDAVAKLLPRVAWLSDEEGAA